MKIKTKDRQFNQIEKLYLVIKITKCLDLVNTLLEKE